MHSMKAKLFSLGLAATLLFGAVGCAATTPTTVGNIGGVEIPAGVYLLAQYNAYNTAAGVATLATGETASDVKAVLAASCTGTIGDEEVTATGSEYVEKLTTRALEYYAAVEREFTTGGGTLDDVATAEAASTADSLWSSNGDLYTANGISKTTVQNYLINSEKAKALLEMTYGADGLTPVSEDEYKAYIDDECYYLETVEIPLMDYNTYSFATTEETAAIEELAAQCQAELETTATAETADSTAIYTAAMSYVPQAMSLLGSDMTASDAVYYAGTQLYTPADLSSYQDTLVAPIDAAGMNHWVTVNMGTSLLVVRRIDPLASYSVDELVSMYGLLDSLKSEEFQNTLYAEGATLDHALDTAAVKTYSASKIKRTV